MPTSVQDSLFSGDVMSIIRGLLLATVAILSVGRANAQVDAAGTKILIPVVSSSVSFVSQIVVKDQSGTSRSVTMQFYEAQTSSTPGLKACTPITLTPFQTKTVSLAGQCSLAAGNHHGFVILTDASGTKDKLFYAFTRVENPATNGFTVEGYPIGHIGGGDPDSEVVGVKSKAATATTPQIQTNCFVATLDNPVSYSISVDVPNALAVSDTLAAFQMRRYSDIGAGAGDFENATVTFTKDDPAQWPNTLIAFCTVQDNASFNADFRIAKTWEAADPTRFRLNCFAASFGAGDTCTDTLQPSAPIVPDAATKVRLLTRVYAPDTVNCKIVGGRASDLKIRLVRDFPPGTVAAGGTTGSFTYTTGPRSGIGNGFHQTYFLEVDFKDGANTAPAAFGIQCKSGNGMMEPYFLGTLPDDF